MHCCATRKHQQNSGVQFESARVLLVEHKLYARFLCKISEASEGADFQKLDPDPVGVAGGRGQD